MRKSGLQRLAQFRLLVVRLGAMGDILHALPAVTALRRSHPLWRIDWLVEPRWRPLLASQEAQIGATITDEVSLHRAASHPIVDGVLEADTRLWRRQGFRRASAAAILQLRAKLRAGEYDAVLEMQGAIRSAALARLTGCRRIIGDTRPREAPARWFYTEPVTAQPADAEEQKHVIDRGYELASAIAADLLETCAPELPVDAAAESWCDREWERLRLGQNPCALVHPGAGWGAKRWPAERYREVAAWLSAQGVRVLVNAGPGEDSLAESVAQGNESAQVVRSSLAELVAMTRRAALVIGGDTGPLHLACALGRPVVGIYGPTDPARNGPYRFPGGEECVVLRTPEKRRDHRRLPEPEAGLLQIDVQAVRAAAQRLLSR